MLVFAGDADAVVVGGWRELVAETVSGFVGTNNNLVEVSACTN